MTLSKFSNLSKLTILAAFLFSHTLLANSYQSFSSLTYQGTNDDYQDTNKYSVSSQYFFADRVTAGPLNEFDYLNNISNISATYAAKQIDYAYYFRDDLNEELLNIGAEFFLGKFKVSAKYNNYDFKWTPKSQQSNDVNSWFSNSDTDVVTVGIGYLLTSNFLLEASYFKVSEQDEIFLFNARYTLSLDGGNYIGFDYKTDEQLDSHALSAKLFMMFPNKSYLVVEQTITYNIGDASWVHQDESGISAGGSASYYFNDFTSISSSLRSDHLSISAKHFINNNFSIELSYGNQFVFSSNNNDDLGYGLNLSMQF